MDQRLRGLELKTSLSALVSLAMPGWCSVCGRRLGYRERFLCLECMADLPLTHFELMDHNPMSERYNEAFGATLERFEPYQWACALFFYNSHTGFANIPRDLKYYRNTAQGRYFARMLALKLRRAHHFDDVDLVVPVPLHWVRRARRGYNQAEVISDEVARTLGVAHDGRLLRRARRTGTQTALNIEQKKANVKGAFRVDLRRARKRNAVHHILLVDDVMTTGSTLAECHKALREFFPPEVRISCATLAVVG